MAHVVIESSLGLDGSRHLWRRFVMFDVGLGGELTNVDLSGLFLLRLPHQSDFEIPRKFMRIEAESTVEHRATTLRFTHFVHVETTAHSVKVFQLGHNPTQASYIRSLSY